MKEPQTFQTFLKYLGRGMKLRCPSCGQKPMFIRWWQVRSLKNWFTPLDGCPVCGYPFERETGYFLMAIWAVSYGFGSVLGVIIYGVLELLYDLPIGTLLTAVLVPVVLFNVLFARHAKALFLAVDLFFDPHTKDGGNDGGNQPLPPPDAPAGAPLANSPRPVEPVSR
jgi:uncharacterized protein (DUF983 family)